MVRLENNIPRNTDEQVLIDQKIAEERHQILELQAQLQKCITQHHERIKELNHQRNMHSKTMRLPPEILHDIFRELQNLYKAANSRAHGYSTRRDSPYQWRELLGVCRHWRSLAINSPSIWTTIHIGHSPRNPRWSNLALERSGTAQLNVVFELSGYGTNHYDRDWERVVVQNIARIRTLAIGTDEYSLYATKWAKVQAPLGDSNDNTGVSGKAAVLERLSIKFPPQNIAILASVPTLSSAWFTIAPHLQHLKLTGINFDWTCSQFHHLRTLYVACDPRVTQLTQINMIQTVFAQMSALENLYLYHVFAPADRTPLPVPATKCNLPKLKTLDLQSASSSSIALFLLSMSFPSLNRFSIEVPPRGSNTNDDHSYFFRALSTLHQPAYHTVSVGNICNLRSPEKIGFEMYFYDGNHSSEGSHIWLPAADLEAVNMQLIADLCAATNLSCLKRLFVEDMPPEAFKANFGCLAHLTCIGARSDKMFSNLIEALMIPLEHPGPQYAQLVFPAIKSIHAASLKNFPDEGDTGWELLQDCLMQRCEYGAPIDDLVLCFFSIDKRPPDQCFVQLSEIVPQVTALSLTDGRIFTSAK